MSAKTFIFISTSIIAVICNIWVLLVILRNRKLHYHIGYFLASLAILDLVDGSFMMPVTLIHEYNHDSWLFTETNCTIWLIFEHSFGCLKMLHLTIMFVIINYVLWKRLELKSFISNRMAVKIIALIYFTVGTSLGAVVLSYKDPKYSSDGCFFHSGTIQTVKMFVLLMSLVITILIILIWVRKCFDSSNRFNTLQVEAVYTNSAVDFFNQERRADDIEHEKKIITLITMLFLTFLIFVFPCVMFVVGTFTEFYYIFDISSYLTCALNPILYIIICPEFRKLQKNN